MAIHYRYFGVLYGDLTPDNPATVVRVWTGPDGQQMEETFKRSLVWKPSHRFSRMRPIDEFNDPVVEIDESVAERFIERLTKRVMAERGRAT